MAEAPRPLIVVSANRRNFVHSFIPPLKENMILAANLEDSSKVWVMSDFAGRNGLLHSISYEAKRGRAPEFMQATQLLGEKIGRKVVIRTSVSPKPRV